MQLAYRTVSPEQAVLGTVNENRTEPSICSELLNNSPIVMYLYSQLSATWA